VWSLGATAWELVHGDPPFSDVQDPRLPLSRNQLPPVRQPEAFSRSFHDFLHLCSQPAASRPDADELLNVRPKPFSIEFIQIIIIIIIFGRLILYGLRAHVQRLFSCWDSARRSMSSSCSERVSAIRIPKNGILFFVFFTRNSPSSHHLSFIASQPLNPLHTLI
jgi:hypothetical protein